MTESHHIKDFEVSKGEGNSVGWCGDRQHEGQRGSDRAGQHHIKRVYLNSDSLRDKEHVVVVYMQKNCVHKCVHIWFRVEVTIEASMGRNRVVVAVLLEHSVNVATRRESTIEIAKGGIFCKGAKRFPSHNDNPDTWKYNIILKYDTWKRNVELDWL